MYLHVSIKNQEAIKLYIKMGFTIYNIIIDYYEDFGSGFYTGEGRNAFEMVCSPIDISYKN